MSDTINHQPTIELIINRCPYCGRYYAREFDRCDPIEPGRDGTDRGTAGRKRDPLTGMFTSGVARG